MDPVSETGVATPSLHHGCVTQMELINENMILQVRNTIKVAVLEGDDDINDLVAVSYYDSKPVYFLSTVVDEVKWITVKKKYLVRSWEEKSIFHFFDLIL